MVWEIALVIFLLVLSMLTLMLIPVVLQLRSTLARIASLVEGINRTCPIS